MSPAAWAALWAELDLWTRARLKATFWWRDDDAVAPTAELERLLALAQRYRVPLGLAVIPAAASPRLVERLDALSDVLVLQHGFAHRNHAPAGERSAEFGPHRSLAQRLADIGEGWRLLTPFRTRTPIFVPPWNRYDPAILPGLARLGLAAVSGFGPRRNDAAQANALEVNCHCDIMDWRGTRGFAGEDKTLAELVSHLRLRRTVPAERDLPTGLLTHHLQHDEACWSFVEELLDRLERHEAAQWITPQKALRT